jgi:3-oxoacyl-[acyl-carrier protein] reductase
MDLGLAGKAALVTGASRGIGLAIARGLATEGARVAIVARGTETLERSRSELAAAGADVRALAVDVASAEGATRAVEWAVAELGRLDVLVNNVGGSLGSGAFDRATRQEWSSVIDLNLMSAVWCSQEAVRKMIAAGGGVIVHVSSICGLDYCIGAAYTAAKAALAGLTKEMGIDLAKHGIRVVAVAPGSTMFEGGSWDRKKKTHPDMVAHMLEHELPWKRFGTPEEIADVVVFAASARAKWVTGTTLVVDGGQRRGV